MITESGVRSKITVIARITSKTKPTHGKHFMVTYPSEKGQETRNEGYKVKCNTPADNLPIQSLQITAKYC